MQFLVRLISAMDVGKQTFPTRFDVIVIPSPTRQREHVEREGVFGRFRIVIIGREINFRII